MFYEGSDHYYPYAVAGKTGHTENAMNTLVTCAEKDGIRLVCVVMKTHGRNVYTDSIALLDYGFSSFQKLDLAGAEESRDISEIEEGAYVYFVHSYYLKAADEQIVKASTDYCTHIHASVERDNVFACQFHPEKSSDVGLHILKNFVEL